MADEDYYEDEYYDDYYGTYDDGAEPAEETWESKIAIKFDDATSLLEYNTPECVRLMREVLGEDEAKGIWSFKAYVCLARAARILHQYDEMLKHYTQAVDTASSGLDMALAEEPMIQFINDTGAVPSQFLDPVLAVTLKATNDHPELWKVRCTALLKRAASHLQAGDATAALADLNVVEAWCHSDSTQTEDQHLSQLFLVHGLQLWAYRLMKQYGARRLVYYNAVQTQPPFVPLTALGDVHYEGGHMFLCDGDWYAAHRAFTSAFRAYTGVGDARRISALMYSALANMLGGAAVDTLSAAENKLLCESPALTSVALLEKAAVAHKVSDVLRVLEDESNAETFKNDELFAPYVDQLLYRVRLDALLDYIQGFTSVRLEHVARHLAWDVEHTTDLCTVAIYQGLNATVDTVANMLYVFDSASTSELIRANKLREWATTATLS